MRRSRGRMPSFESAGHEEGVYTATEPGGRVLMRGLVLRIKVSLHTVVGETPFFTCAISPYILYRPWRRSVRVGSLFSSFN